MEQEEWKRLSDSLRKNCFILAMDPYPFLHPSHPYHVIARLKIIILLPEEVGREGQDSRRWGFESCDSFLRIIIIIILIIMVGWWFIKWSAWGKENDVSHLCDEESVERYSLNENKAACLRGILFLLPAREEPGQEGMPPPPPLIQRDFAPDSGGERRKKEHPCIRLIMFWAWETRRSLEDKNWKIPIL